MFFTIKYFILNDKCDYISSHSEITIVIDLETFGMVEVLYQEGAIEVHLTDCFTRASGALPRKDNGGIFV